MTLKQARASAEKQLGIRFPNSAAKEVLAYARRKCMAAGKPKSYLPVLYENELMDFARRVQINARGDKNYVLWVS